MRIGNNIRFFAVSKFSLYFSQFFHRPYTPLIILCFFSSVKQLSYCFEKLLGMIISWKLQLEIWSKCTTCEFLQMDGSGWFLSLLSDLIATLVRLVLKKKRNFWSYAPSPAPVYHLRNLAGAFWSRDGILIKYLPTNEQQKPKPSIITYMAFSVPRM